MYKIEIKGTEEDLERISIFLDNNHIKHQLVRETTAQAPLTELIESIDWPF